MDQIEQCLEKSCPAESFWEILTCLDSDTIDNCSFSDIPKRINYGRSLFNAIEFDIKSNTNNDLEEAVKWYNFFTCKTKEDCNERSKQYDIALRLLNRIIEDALALKLMYFDKDERYEELFKKFSLIKDMYNERRNIIYERLYEDLHPEEKGRILKLKDDLRKAVEEEGFEIAIKIRDEIRGLYKKARETLDEKLNNSESSSHL